MVELIAGYALPGDAVSNMVRSHQLRVTLSLNPFT